MDGVVLAAGRSVRMGRPKALLDAGGETFVARAVRVLRAGGCRDVVVVVPPADTEAIAAEAGRAGARVVVNPDAGAEQVESLRLALAALPADAAAAAILPVDCPAVRPATVAALLAAYRARRAPVVRPVVRGTPGHPLLLDRRLFGNVSSPDLVEGVRTVVESHSAEREDVPVDDDGALLDVDTPGDYRRFAAFAAPLSAAGAADLLVRAREEGVGAAVVVVLSATAAAADAPGALPAPAARLLLREDGAVHGSFGDAALDATAVELAQRVLAGGEPVVEEVEAGGARLTVYAEPAGAPEELLIAGAGHIAVPLARIGALLGLRVTVLDDRPEFARTERFPEAARVLRVDFGDPFRDVVIGPRSYVVLVTRGHRYDFDLLRRLLALETPPRYLGMIGSRRRVRAAFRALLDDGVPRERLAAVHAPIGLDLGAETPAEIAVAIAAEIVRARRGGSALPLRDVERVLDRLMADDDG